MHQTRRTLVARSLVLGMALPACMALSACTTPFWFMRDEAPPTVALPEEPAPIPEVMDAAPVDAGPAELQVEMMDAPMAPRAARVLPKPMNPAAKKPPPAKAATGPKEVPPVVELGDLVGSDFASVLQVFRRPDTVQNSALSIVWTYLQPDCTLQLFFYPDIQTTVFHLLKYDLKSNAGEKLGTSSECMQHIATPRSHGAVSP